MFGDNDICHIDPESYRKNLSLVAQESSLYEGTIKQNVSLSVDESLATDAAVQEACQSAQIHDFVTSLPDGYSTMIGSRGVALSGGQRQRLSLARALLRRPRLLLLDEATSNLDSESEKLVQQAIEKAAGEGGPTIISVAHRLATIQNADIIFVLGSGKVLESGNHAALLAKRGVYYQMVRSLPCTYASNYVLIFENSVKLKLSIVSLVLCLWSLVFSILCNEVKLDARTAYAYVMFITTFVNNNESYSTKIDS
jgi:ATP-binding cassette subfamily B (MDR/TAP) protein 1